jgi:hypothetical protein
VGNETGIREDHGTNSLVIICLLRLLIAIVEYALESELAENKAILTQGADVVHLNDRSILALSAHQAAATWLSKICTTAAGSLMGRLSEAADMVWLKCALIEVMTVNFVKPSQMMLSRC